MNGASHVKHRIFTCMGFNRRHIVQLVSRSLNPEGEPKVMGQLWRPKFGGSTGPARVLQLAGKLTF